LVCHQHKHSQARHMRRRLCIIGAIVDTFCTAWVHMELVDVAVWCSQRVGRHVVVTTCHAKNIRKMADLQTTPRQGCATTLWGRGAPNQGPGRYFGDSRRPGSRSNHPQCAPPKSLRILLWASRFAACKFLYSAQDVCNLFDWLRFLGKTITPKQRQLEVGALAWLEKHLEA
jgi:hypothetical protein